MPSRATRSRSNGPRRVGKWSPFRRSTALPGSICRSRTLRSFRVSGYFSIDLPTISQSRRHDPYPRSPAVRRCPGSNLLARRRRIAPWTKTEPLDVVRLSQGQWPWPQRDGAAVCHLVELGGDRLPFAPASGKPAAGMHGARQRGRGPINLGHPGKSRRPEIPLFDDAVQRGRL